MTSQSLLVDVFLAQVPARLAALADDAVQTALSALLDNHTGAAQQEWTGFSLPGPLFAQYLAERMGDADGWPAALRKLEGLHAPDLYLACGCVAGLASAIRAFDTVLVRQVPRSVRHMNLSDASVDDVMQELRQSLLVGTEERPPRLSMYDGSGKLTAFLSVSAVRAALNRRRSKDEQAVRDDGSLAEHFAGTTPDPQLEALKRRYLAEFKTALQSAIDSLTSEQRNLLVHYYIDGLSTTKLAVMFSINQSTVSRRISETRSDIYEKTRQQLRKKMCLSDSEFIDLSRMVQSQLDLSLSRILRK